MPKVSVIVAVYNVEKYLRQCLDSLVNQTLQDIEILCINDGSTDSSLEILNEYAKNDQRIKIFTKENEGQAVARNFGITQANGEYIAFVDSDDWCELDMYEHLYNEAKKIDAELVECNCYHYNDMLEKKFVSQKKLKGIPYGKSFNWLDLSDKALVFENSPVAPWNKLCKTAFVRDNDLKFGLARFAEDAYFTLRIRVLASKIVHLDKYLYNYRIREGSTIKTLYNYNFSNQINMVKETKDFIVAQGIFEILEKGFISHAVGQLATVYKTIPVENKDAFKLEILEKLGSKVYKRFQQKTGKKIFEKLLKVGNKSIDSHKYKVLTLLGFDIKLKKIY